jgi:hypothetical protein
MLSLPQNNIPKLPSRARRFEVLHRRNYYEGAPWAPDCAEDIPFLIYATSEPTSPSSEQSAFIIRQRI